MFAGSPIRPGSRAQYDALHRPGPGAEVEVLAFVPVGSAVTSPVSGVPRFAGVPSWRVRFADGSTSVVRDYDLRPIHPMESGDPFDDIDDTREAAV